MKMSKSSFYHSAANFYPIGMQLMPECGCGEGMRSTECPFSFLNTFILSKGRASFFHHRPAAIQRTLFITSERRLLGLSIEAGPESRGSDPRTVIPLLPRTRSRCTAEDLWTRLAPRGGRFGAEPSCAVCTRHAAPHSVEASLRPLETGVTKPSERT